MRIIAGRFRGRVIAAPRGLSTRPTSDRVREALFSILGDVEGLDVLDLYAGSGALGLEALSRGARSATFVERARAAVAALRANVTTLGVDGAVRLHAGAVDAALRGLARDGRRFGLVLCDPPYAEPDVARVLAELVRLDLLAPGAWIVLEHATRREPPEPEGLTRRFARTYGDTALTFYRWSSTEAA